MSHEPYSSARGRTVAAIGTVASPSRLPPILGVVLGLLHIRHRNRFLSRPVAFCCAAYSEQQADEEGGEAYAGVRSMRVVTGRVVDNPSEALPVAVNSRLGVAVANYFINTAAANPRRPQKSSQ